VATTDNMFVEHGIDVTDRLHPGANTLEVRFASAERVGGERLAASADLAAFQVQAGRRHGLLPRSMVRKAQYHWGWDWGPRLRGCGIWRDVVLVRVPTARLTDWSWRARFHGDGGGATVTVEAATDGAADELEVRLHGHGTDTSATGAGRVELHVDDAKRWWCAGLGEQALYDLTIVAKTEGEAIDRIDARIGLREVELVREPDDAGESFVFHVNGVPIFAKGANWIPDDSFPARTTRERVFEQLRMARDCGMNMLRIWGGGLYETTDFYDACDELGLLVWQDFPYACAMYPEDDDTVAAAVAEATAAVRRVRNHTSLALWCGNNENQWLAHMGFFGRIPKVLGERLYDDALPAVVAAEDPDRPYWPSSPWGSEANPSGDGTGDCHYWNVWHGEGDWTHYTKCTSRFVSEFGFSGPPDRRTLEEVLRPDELGVDTPAMRWHDKTSKGYDTYLGYIALHYPQPETYEDLVYYGQLNQADAMRFGIEHFRRLRPHTMGTLAWQLNDCWPVQSWAWIDHALRPKAVWYAAKRFYAPLLLTLWSGDDHRTVRVSLVNDEVDRRRTGTLALQAFGPDGKVVWSSDVEVAVDPASSAVVHELSPPDGAVLLHATFDDVESTFLLAEPKDLVLPPADLQVTTGPDNTVQLETSTPALGVMLWLEGEDATWSDNFLHVFPGARRTVEVRPASATASVGDRLRWRALR
jgi:beta-mannosidase